MMRPPLIRNFSEVKEKLELLDVSSVFPTTCTCSHLPQALGDVKIALNLIRGSSAGDEDINWVCRLRRTMKFRLNIKHAKIDAKYKSLNIDIHPLSKTTDEYKMIEKSAYVDKVALVSSPCYCAGT